MKETRGGTKKPDSKNGELRPYRVRVHVEQTIYAEDEDETLGIFWDDLMRSQAEEDNATVKEM